MKPDSLLKNMYQISVFSLPIGASMLISMISSFVTMVMVAQTGQVELAAGALAVPTFMTVMTIFSTIFYAIGILISHCSSQKKSPGDIGNIVKSGYWLAFFLMFPSVSLIWHIDYILILFKQDPHLIELTRGYFHFAALTMIPTLISVVTGQFFTGIGKPRFVMIVSAINLPLVIIFAYGFVSGHFGLPKLGLAGITCAAFIGQTIVCAGVITYLVFAKHVQPYRIFSNLLTPDIALCKKIFYAGLPIGIQFGAELGAMAVATYFMGFFGVAALTASQIVSQYSILLVMVTLGISQGLSILTSKAFGQNDLALARQYLISAHLVLVLIFATVILACLLWPKAMISVYLSDNDMANTALVTLIMDLFVVSIITLYIDGIRNLFSGALRGLQDSKSPMRIGVICLWLISLPASYLAGFVIYVDPVGVRAGFITGFLIASIALWLKLKNQYQANAMLLSMSASRQPA